MIVVRPVRALLPAECELCGYKRKTRRHLLCRPQPGGGERAGRRSSRADRSERYREPIQPHGHRRGHYEPAGESEASHPHRAVRQFLRPYQKLRGAVGAGADVRQAPPAGKNGGAAGRRHAFGGFGPVYQLWPDPPEKIVYLSAKNRPEGRFF